MVLKSNLQQLNTPPPRDLYCSDLLGIPPVVGIVDGMVSYSLHHIENENWPREVVVSLSHVLRQDFAVSAAVCKDLLEAPTVK